MNQQSNHGGAMDFGANEVVDALVESGVDTFFANPGTSEIHLVSAMDRNPHVRAVLCLFEGVATGAADGYARATGKPAAVLLHLGPGLANGLANLHNAYKARSPMIVLVGEHTVAHLRHDSPLRSDLPSLAGYAAKHVFHMGPEDALSSIVAEAVRTATQAPAGPVVIVANADVMWGYANRQAIDARAKCSKIGAEWPDAAAVTRAAGMLKHGEGAALILGGEALSAEGQELADRIAQATGCRLYSETFNARQERGAGVPVVERLPYFREQATDKLATARYVVLAGSRPPVAFFASPDAASELTRPDAEMLATPQNTSPLPLLRALAEATAPNIVARQAPRKASATPYGPLSPRNIWAAINLHLPEDAIVSDEAGVTSAGSDAAMQGARRHVWMNLTGGSIGQGLPLATGAAVGARDKLVVAVHGDGGAMYTVQALWTQARERLRVVNVIFRNDRYGILEHEVKRHGLGPLGPKGSSMFALTQPIIGWTDLARSMGVRAESVTTAEDFAASFEHAVQGDGPTLIEVVIAGKP